MDPYEKSVSWQILLIFMHRTAPMKLRSLPEP